MSAVGASKPFVGPLLQIARDSAPHDFQAFFCGGVIANVVGNLPEDYWQQFRKCEPCDRPGCDCHVLSAKIMPALEFIRADHLDVLAKQRERS